MAKIESVPVEHLKVAFMLAYDECKSDMEHGRYPLEEGVRRVALLSSLLTIIIRRLVNDGVVDNLEDAASELGMPDVLAKKIPHVMAQAMAVARAKHAEPRSPGVGE